MYDQESTAVSTALKDASPITFSDNTISQILALSAKDGNTTVTFANATPDADGNVTVAAGTEVVFVTSSDTVQTTVKAPASAPVVIFQGKGGIDAVIGEAGGKPGANTGTPDRVVVGSSGNDKIVIADAHNTKVILGTGDSTVQAGAGHDTIEAGQGNSTIVGGSDNHTIVKLTGDASDYVVTVVDGHAVVTHTGQGATSTDLSHVQYVQLDNKEALIIANDTKEAAVSTLYHAAFGRDADAGGIETWFAAAKAGASLQQIADGFIGSAEFKALAAQTDAEFLSSLYQNTFNRAGDSEGLTFWTNQLANGHTRAELLANFVNIASLNQDGTLHTEAVVVGSVTIVQGIV